MFYIIGITRCSFVTDLCTCGQIIKILTAKLIFLTHCDRLSIPLALSSFPGQKQFFAFTLLDFSHLAWFALAA